MSNSKYMLQKDKYSLVIYFKNKENFRVDNVSEEMKKDLENIFHDRNGLDNGDTNPIIVSIDTDLISVVVDLSCVNMLSFLKQ